MFTGVLLETVKLLRTLRDKVKKVEQSHHHLEQTLHRSPTAVEVANYIGLTTHEVESIMKDSLMSNILSIEEKSNRHDGGKEGIGYSIPDQTSIIPESQILQEEIVIELAQAIKKLNKKEQIVVSLFYFDELTLQK
ncbi:sigma-70 domain-containing protein [Oceanobacillus senegalensis]|uniref:sigma-70 domain-containing protein n=1 Tax=Oceanobacillus senegalensis TaxID=1936063 RepID=UPI002481F6F1|nr:sigma-70 domain-containing protein [Oceanobacillus senegalensis]